MINKVILFGSVSNLEVKPWKDNFINTFKLTVVTVNNYTGKEIKMTIKCSSFTKSNTAITEGGTYLAEGSIVVNSVPKGKIGIDYTSLLIDSMTPIGNLNKNNC